MKTMTTGELISLLHTADPSGNIPVVLCDWDGFIGLLSVEKKALYQGKVDSEGRTPFSEEPLGKKNPVEAIVFDTFPYSKE